VIFHVCDWVFSVTVAVRIGASRDAERILSEEKNGEVVRVFGRRDTYLIWRLAVGWLWVAPLRTAAAISVVLVIIKSR